MLSGRRGRCRVNGISFSIEDPTPLVDQARELAVQRAQDKADALAELSDIKLGSIIKVSESGGVPPPTVGLGGAFAEERAFQAGNTPIQGGDITVSVYVYVTFAIE